MSDDPYATPTDEAWAAIEERFRETDRIYRAAMEEYFVAFEAWRKVMEDYHVEFKRWERLKALRTPVRDYVISLMEHIIAKRPRTAKQIDPHHRPADVEKALDDLIAEGKVHKIGKGYEWIR